VTISVTALATSSGRHRLPKFVGKAIRSQRDSSNHPRQTLPPALATDAAVVIPETARRVAPLIQRCQNLSREFSRFVENHRGRFHRRALVSAEFGKVGKPSAFGQNKQGRSRVLKGGSANIAQYIATPVFSTALQAFAGVRDTLFIDSPRLISHHDQAIPALGKLRREALQPDAGVACVSDRPFCHTMSIGSRYPSLWRRYQTRQGQ
jgi:hypothetical protein